MYGSINELVKFFILKVCVNAIHVEGYYKYEKGKKTLKEPHKVLVLLLLLLFPFYVAA